MPLLQTKEPHNEHKDQRGIVYHDIPPSVEKTHLRFDGDSVFELKRGHSAEVAHMVLAIGEPVQSMMKVSRETRAPWPYSRRVHDKLH